MSKNKELLDSFIEYCKLRPSLRFWQALSNWARLHLFAVTSKEITRAEVLGVPHQNLAKDTYYWEGVRD